MNTIKKNNKNRLNLMNKKDNITKLFKDLRWMRKNMKKLNNN